MGAGARQAWLLPCPAALNTSALARLFVRATLVLPELKRAL